MPPQYKQKFRLAWLKSDKFKDWLLPIDDDPTRATCKWCKCTITVKLTDIDNHSKSTQIAKPAQTDFAQSLLAVSSDRKATGCMQNLF
ncbi:hypothetical protein EAI_09006 [Harpegnathos saltator]|uniref:Uncharacterized protein n=1 Tax=Harpegnathos saltator TaxID=610380 RepID=E2BVM5_HARSA|nr:hypothetical protein EAI_09006 [Harpegnathos saltator]